MKTTKKSLAFILALVMMLTLIPASAFAATNNTVTTVPTVASDKDMPIVTLNLRVSDDSGIPANSMQNFVLRLDNATWAKYDDGYTGDIVTKDDSKDLPTDAAIKVLVATESGLTAKGANVNDLTFDSADNNYISISMNSTEAIKKDGYIQLQMALHAGDDAGEVKVNIESLDGQISGGSYVVGTVAGGDTIAKVVNDPKKVTRAVKQEGATIEIREAAVTSVTKGTQSIKLTLPKGVTWDYDNTVVSGIMIDGTAPKITPYGSDSRDAELTFTAKGDNAIREVLTIKPQFAIGRDAKQGDIDVQIRSIGNSDISDASGLVVAIYGDDAVNVTTVKENDIPDIIAGFETKDGGDKYTVKVTLEEVTKNSLTRGKYVEFAFPEWVQVVSEGAIEVKVNGSKLGQGENTNGIYKDGEFSIKDDNSVVEWTVPDSLSKTKTNKVEFKIPVTVEAGHSGDLTMKVSGPKAGVSDTELVVANIVQPVTAEVKLSDVRTGIQKQKGGDIVIKESEAGLIRDDSKDKITLSIDDLDFNGINFDDADVKVTKGDLEIGKKVDITKGVISIPVERSSIKEPAEITISNVTLNLDRTMPEGKYAVKVAGDAVIDNQLYNDDDFASSAAKADYVNIITRADGNIYGEAKFKIGEKKYSVLVNGELQEFEMDTAAFTKDQRTMIPVKYVMLALGGTEDDVVWNQAAQTATFFKGDRVCVIKIGSNVMTVNGAEVVMDTAAFTKDQRTFVPIKYVATALGCTVSWDAATETVTINQ